MFQRFNDGEKRQCNHNISVEDICGPEAKKVLAAMSRKNSNQKTSASTVENTNVASAKGTEMKNRKPIAITESKGLPAANFDLRLIRIEKEVVELTKKKMLNANFMCFQF